MPRSYRVAFVILTIILSQPAAAAELAGTVPGEFAVEDHGLPSFTVPIQVPPGTNGMQPDLALAFFGGRGSGRLGVGWTLVGFSDVQRCPTGIEPDGFIDPVDFDSNDQFCLDGERLIAVSGAYGQPGTEYRTERNTFAKVISNGQNETGPQSFTVYTQNGRILEYGTSPDSNIGAQGVGGTFLWQLATVTDRFGNTIRYTYYENPINIEFQPIRIDYTENLSQGLAAYNHVEFVYEDRPDKAVRWLGGTKTLLSVRMKGVRTFADGELVREYNLTYSKDPLAERSRIDSVTECGADSQCLPVTTFDWTGGTVDQYSVFNNPRNQDGQLLGWGPLVSDYNGDGLTDILWAKLDIYGRMDGDRVYWPNIGNGQFDGIQSSLPSTGPIQGYTPYVGDFNGDGLSDILWQETQTNGLSFDFSRYWMSRGDDPSANGPFVQKAGPSLSVNNRLVLGDFDGDGRTDVLYARTDGYKRILYSDFVGQEDPTFEPRDVCFPDMNQFGNHSAVVGDFNGDGQSDILWNPPGNGERVVWLSIGRPGLSTDPCFTTSTGHPEHPRVDKGNNLGGYAVSTGDFNGDGLTDILWNNRSNGAMLLWPSAGHGGFDAANNSLPEQGQLTNYSAQVTDFNADGLSDIYWSRTDNQGRATGDRRIWISQATDQNDGFRFDVRISDVPAQGAYVGYVAHLGDYDGDGLPGFFFDRKDDQGRSADDTRSVWVDDNAMADQMTRITDGLGVITEITYTPLTDPNVYTKFTDAVYPIQDVQPRGSVVRTVATSNGIGGMLRTHYHYRGIRNHLRGRGSLGYAEVVETDETTGIATTTFYRQDYPLNGLVDQVEIHLSNNTLIDRSVNTYGVQLFGEGSHFFVEPQQGVRDNFEIDGSHIATTVSNQEFDSFGNVTRAETLYDDGSSMVDVNTYDNDAANWLIGQLTRKETTASSPTSTAQTRVSTFDYDGITGALVSQSIEPGTSNHVSTTYAYDSFGNPEQTTVAGAGITPRVSTVTYDTRGQFALSSTNPLQHSTSQSFSNRFGTPISTTDLNQLTTIWEYDSLGRETRVIRSDGSSTTTTRSLCTSNCEFGHSMVTTTLQDGQPPRIGYLDILQRTIVTETEGFDGTRVLQRTEYDELGRVDRASLPYYEGDGIYWSQPSYDTIGRVLVQTQPDGTTVESSYSGLQTVATNDAGQTHTEIRDGRNQVVQVIDHLGGSNFYEYDGFGNLTKVTDAGNDITSLTYDHVGRKIAMDDPDMGHWTYEYDALGQLTREVSANRKSTTFKYDLIGRLLERRESRGKTTWEYDIAQNGLGKIATIESKEGKFERTLQYDSLSRLASSTTEIRRRSFTLDLRYDDFSRLETLTYPTGLRVRNNYNARGFLNEVRDDAGSTIYWEAQATDAHGNFTQELLGNGLTSERVFNPNTGEIDFIGTGFGAGLEIQNLAYEWDTLRNLKSRADFNQGLTESITYDPLNRMKSSSIAGGQTKTYSYDATGNILFKSDVGTYNYDDPAHAHAVTSVAGLVNETYKYDKSGNQTSGAGRKIKYTAFNKPSKVIKKGTSRRKLYYGPDRGLIYQDDRKLSNPRDRIETRYIGKLFEEVTTRDGATKQLRIEQKHFISSPTGLVAIHTQSTAAADKTVYVHKDHLGSTDVITDVSGNIVEKLSFDPHGLRRNSNWTSAPVGSIQSQTNRGFTGHEQLDDVGLVHMGGRVYDPVLGRFLSADPTTQFRSSTQGFNRYAYVNNNPLSFIDPSGFGIGRYLKKIEREVRRGVRKAAKAFVKFIDNEEWFIGASPFAIGTALSKHSLEKYNPFYQSAQAIANGASISDTLKNLGKTLGTLALLAIPMVIFQQWELAPYVVAALGTVGISVTETAFLTQFAVSFISGAVSGAASGLANGGNVLASAARGALSSILGTLVSAGASTLSRVGTALRSVGTLGSLAANIARKIWTSPNTALGLVWGGIGFVGGNAISLVGRSAYFLTGGRFGSTAWYGGSIRFGNNALQFLNNPLQTLAQRRSAVTLGNVQVFSRLSDDPRNLLEKLYGSATRLNLALHEEAHTYQFEVFGPLFIPIWALAGGPTSSNAFEQMANNFAGGGDYLRSQ